MGGVETGRTDQTGFTYTLAGIRQGSLPCLRVTWTQSRCIEKPDITHPMTEFSIRSCTVVQAHSNIRWLNSVPLPPLALTETAPTHH
jgi:hypothetical protein